MFSQLTKLSKITEISTFRSPVSSHIFPAMNFSTESLVVENERSKKQFVINHEGFQAQLLYDLKGRTINFTHTGVPTEMEGRGVGKILAKEGLKFAKDKNLKVEVSCHFVKHYIDKYEPEFPYVSKV